MLDFVRKNNEPVFFEEDAIINPDAPVYEPHKWNDLGLDSNDNVDAFFQHLNTHYYDIIVSLQAANLVSLGNIVALADTQSEYPYGNLNASRIKRLLPEEDIANLVETVNKFFSHQQTRANCYGYSINFQSSYPGSKPDPAGKTKEYERGLYNDFTAAVIDGAVEDGLIHAGATLPEPKLGYYRVAVATAEGKGGQGYHWLREDFNTPYWSHKSGHQPATNKDDNDHFISDPVKAVMGNYEVKAFFFVPKGGVRPTCLDAG